MSTPKPLIVRTDMIDLALFLGGFVFLVLMMTVSPMFLLASMATFIVLIVRARAAIRADDQSRRERGLV